MPDHAGNFSWHAAAMVAVLYAGFPLLGARLVLNREEVLQRSRRELYGQSMVALWAATILALLSARFDGRLADAFRLPGRAAASASSLLAVTGLTLAATFLAAALLEAIRPLRRWEDPLVWKLIPETAAEKRLFVLLALTAGLCEEFLYRGFAIGRVSLWMPLPVAVVASTLAFVFTHLYQGVAGIIRAAVLGSVLLAAFLYSGSLWPGICAHFLFDLAGGLYWARQKVRLR